MAANGPLLDEISLNIQTNYIPAEKVSVASIASPTAYPVFLVGTIFYDQVRRLTPKPNSTPIPVASQPVRQNE